MDDFYTKKICDRCKAPLDGVRKMSIFNTDCLCMKCIEAEKSFPKYEEARLAELEEVKRGNYNFKGIGL